MVSWHPFKWHRVSVTDREGRFIKKEKEKNKRERERERERTRLQMSGLKNSIDRSVTRYVVVVGFREGFRIDPSLMNMMLKNILVKNCEWFEMLRYFIILWKYFSKSNQRRNLIPLLTRFCLQEIVIDLIKMIYCINYNKKREILNSIVQFHRSRVKNCRLTAKMRKVLFSNSLIHIYESF